MIIIVIAQFLWQDNQLRITAIFSIIKEINSKRIAALCGRAGLFVKNFQVVFHMRQIRVTRNWEQ